MTTMMAITTTNTTNTNTLSCRIKTHPPPLNTVVPNLTMTGLETRTGYFFFLLHFLLTVTTSRDLTPNL